MSSNGRANNLNDLKEEGDPKQVAQKVDIQAFDADATWLSKNMTVDEQLHNGAFVGPDDRGISSLEVASESAYEPFGYGYGSDYGSGSFDSSDSSEADDNQITSSLVVGDNVSGQQLVVGSIHQADYTNSSKNSSNLEICKDLSISPSRRPQRENSFGGTNQEIWQPVAFFYQRLAVKGIKGIVSKGHERRKTKPAVRVSS